MLNLDHNKLSISQATSNSDGKTSGTGFLGIIGGIVSLIGILAGIVIYCINQNVMLVTICIAFFSTCAGLLAYRKNQETKITLDNNKEITDK